MTIRNRISLDDLLLLGPGPSTVDPKVLNAFLTPVLGHLDPLFLSIMHGVQTKLRRLFKTENKFTFPISGTGTAGMESCLVNVVEPHDKVLVGVNGYFGERLVDIAQRCKAEVISHDVEWGEPLHGFVDRIKTEKPSVVAFVHAETSTGVLQDPEGICRAAHNAGSLVIMDCVTSLGGIDVRIDEWGVDAAYSGTQKCIGAPPGLAPVTFSDRAIAKVMARKEPVPSFYLDVSLLAKYWDGGRAYHHTAPISMVYALDKALDLIEEEGLENRFQRHQLNHEALMAGLDALGLELASDPSSRLPVLNPIKVPDNIRESFVRDGLLIHKNIEVGAGLGIFKGKVWRVGLMGHSSSQENVIRFLAALGDELDAALPLDNPEIGAQAAREFYNAG